MQDGTFGHIGTQAVIRWINRVGTARQEVIMARYTLWNRVITTGTPRVTSQHSLEGHEAAFGNAVSVNGRHGILRTCRFETTRPPQNGREHELVHPNQQLGGRHPRSVNPHGNLQSF